MDDTPQLRVTEAKVPGLFLVQDFLSQDEASQILEAIEMSEWKSNRAGNRRVQIYGPYHDSKYQVKKNGPVTPLPDWVGPICDKIKTLTGQYFPQLKVHQSRLGEDRYTEIFINEYKFSDGLQFHKDHRSTYAECICGISLVSDCVFTFKKGTKEVDVDLPPNSLYLMTGPSRFDWQHGIHPERLSGDRRISITLRIVQYND